MDYRQEYSERPEYRFGLQGSMPPVVKTLIIINVVVFILQQVIESSPKLNDTNWLNETFGLYYPLGVMRGYIWQFITYAFMHANLMHILFNMFFLWMFGKDVERALGRRRFLTFYLSAAAFSGILYVLFALARRKPVPCIGASGAVMAVVMAYALYWPNRKILFMIFFPMRVRTFVMVVIAIQIFGVLDVTNHVANSAHLGGLLWGFIFVRYQHAMERFMARRPRTGGRQTTPAPSIAEERRLDDILDKVHRNGLGSLSWSEKRFLKKMSRDR